MNFRYTIFALLTAAAIGCSASSTAPADAATQGLLQIAVENGIRETATGRLVDSTDARMLVATLTLENLGSTGQPTLWGQDCLGNGPLDIRVYRGTTLVWEASRRTPFMACPVRAIQDTIPGHGSMSYSWRLPVKAILGDSLPPGTYSLAVHPTLAAPQLKAEVSAGDLLLSDPKS